MSCLYDDIAYVIRNSKSNKWLKSFKAGKSYWAPSMVDAVICDAGKADSLMNKLHKTSHAKHVHIRTIGVIDD